MHLLRSSSIFVGSIVIALAGCGGGGGGEKVKLPDTSPAAGVVTYNDKPLAGAQVLFMSQISKQNLWVLSGTTDATGKFEMETIVGAGRAKGVPVGEYTVTVTKQEVMGKADAEAVQKEMMEKMKTSSPADLGKTPMGPKSLVPVKYTTEAQSDLKVTIDKAGNPKIELKLVD